MRISLACLVFLAACGDDLASGTPVRSTCIDEDGDGYGAGKTCTAFDCDDEDPLRNPGEPELCDAAERDEDCDGFANDDDPSGATDATAYYRDADGDGYGDIADQGRSYCSAPAGRSLSRDDCDDADAERHPAGTEVCDDNDADDDCDGLSDDDDPDVSDFPDLYYPDGDLDGHGDMDDPGTGYCDAGFGRSLLDDDCDDADSEIHGAAEELCDADDVDEDCDGEADDLDDDAVGPLTYYVDGDTDGFGDVNDPGALYCDPPDDAVADNTDCDDGATGVNPDATEICDPADVDEDCQNGADEADPNLTEALSLFIDSDGDGFGAEGSTAVARCELEAGWVSNDDDCDDDGAPLVNPDGTEVCDPANVDEDCENGADDADPNATGKVDVFTDSDGDGFGAEGSDPLALQRCDPEVGESTNAADCDDDDAPLVNPDGTEVCDLADTDEDCDGGGDDADPDGDAGGAITFYNDVDGDTHTGTATNECDPEADDELVDDGDCDDEDEDTYPGALEQCDGVQNNCNGPRWEPGDLTAEDDIVSYEPLDGPAQRITTAFVTDRPYVMPMSGEIWVCPGTYNVELQDNPTDDHPNGLILRSRDPTLDATRTFLDGQGSGSVLNLYTGIVTVDGLTIQNGAGTNVSGELRGGGIHLVASSFTLRNSYVLSNSAVLGGGIYLGLGAQLHAFDSHIGGAGAGNTATQGGGIYYDYGQLDLHGCVIASNQATGAGGGVHMGNDSVLFEDTTVTANSAGTNGGGLFTDAAIGAVCRSPTGLGAFTDNTAVSGGGVYLGDGVATFENDADAPCDFGAGSTDNTPVDVHAEGPFSSDLSVDGAVPFACLLGACL